MERSMLVRALIRTAGLAASVAMAATAVDAWNVSINGRRSSDFDKATAVAIDPSNGNVFVAGTRQVESSNTQFVVGKLTSTGEKVWHHIVEGTADVGTSAGAAAVAVDPGGFVFVAGTVGNLNTGSDIVIKKIDGRAPSKNVLWTRVVDVLGSDDLVSAITLAPDGGVAVAGSARAASGATNGFLMKFAGDGTNAWPSPQIVSGTSSDGLNSINAAGTLPNGDVAVAGSVLNTGSNFDLLVGRFDGRTGAALWLAALNDPAVNNNELGTALAIAANGDIVAGGQTRGRFSGGDFSVFRFSGSGTLLWGTTIDSGFFDAVRALAVGPGGASSPAEHCSCLPGPTVPPFSSSIWMPPDGNAGGTQRWSSLVPRSPRTRVRWHRQPCGHRAQPGQQPGGDDVRCRRTREGQRDGLVETPRRRHHSTSERRTRHRRRCRDRIRRCRRSDAKRTHVVRHDGDRHPERRGDLAAHCDRSSDASGPRRCGRLRWPSILSGTLSPWQGSRRIPGRVSLERRTSSESSSCTKTELSRGNTTSTMPSPTSTTRQPRSLSTQRVISSRPAARAARAPRPALPSCASAHKERNCGERFCLARVKPTRSSVDPQDGNVIVAGKLTSPKSIGGTAFTVVKLDANTGRTLWPASVEDSPLGSANALVLTTRGTVAVAGAVDGRFAVLEYSTGTGVILARGALLNGQALSVAFDSRDGSVVAVGQRPSSTLLGSQLAVAKFDGAGTAIWSRDFGDSNSTSIGASVAVNQNTGSIAVGGTLNRGTSTTLLLESDGRERWRSQNSVGFGTDRTNAVAFAGNTVIAAGQLADGDDVVFQVTGFADDGTEAWRRAFRGSSESGEGAGAAVALDESRRSIFVAGVVVNNPTGPDMFAAGLDFNGDDLAEVPLRANR